MENVDLEKGRRALFRYSVAVFAGGALTLLAFALLFWVIRIDGLTIEERLVGGATSVVAFFVLNFDLEMPEEISALLPDILGYVLVAVVLIMSAVLVYRFLVLLVPALRQKRLEKLEKKISGNFPPFRTRSYVLTALSSFLEIAACAAFVLLFPRVLEFVPSSVYGLVGSLVSMVSAAVFLLLVSHVLNLVSRFLATAAVRSYR